MSKHFFIYDIDCDFSIKTLLERTLKQSLRIYIEGKTRRQEALYKFFQAFIFELITPVMGGVNLEVEGGRISNFHVYLQRSILFV